ncbi:hypothetical protein [Flavobacterium sp. GCM10023249]|uniref:hypothetical protein n=1 Tax=unclassified Flavobacterium TaxID=196869 RepID=UPI003611EB3B
MKNKILIAILFVFIGCNIKNEQSGKSSSVTKLNIEKKEKDIAVWLDTITTDKKFLKIYSTSEDNYKKIYAEWGKNKIRHKSLLIGDELIEFQTPFDAKIEWTTNNSFGLVNSCGTNCRYAIIYNIEKDKPFWFDVLYYPNISYFNYATDNKDLCICSTEYSNGNRKLRIFDIDSQKNDTIMIPENWKRGVGHFDNIIDSINIKNNQIEIFQFKEEIKSKRIKLSKAINLK